MSPKIPRDKNQGRENVHQSKQGADWLQKNRDAKESNDCHFVFDKIFESRAGTMTRGAPYWLGSVLQLRPFLPKTFVLGRK